MKFYIKRDTGTLAALTKEQKKAVGLLSIGTFLEYFDLMLYVHMAVLLNELFFPKDDPYTTAIYSATAFCSTYLLRPIGALIFGWIGDNIGRKATVVITTFMMAISCIVMAIIPTYAEKGIVATILVTICRVLQGMSSLGEIVGARLYLTEITKPPMQYIVVGLVSICTLIGGLAALGIAWVCISLLLNWRYAFGIGALIALVGAAARTKLRETPEFANAKHRIKQRLNKLGKSADVLKCSPSYTAKVNYKTSLSYLSILSMWPATFFFVYIYCGNIFISQFHYTSEQVIQNNFYVTLFNLLVLLILVGLSAIIHPIKILKVRIIIFLIALPIGLYLLSNINSANQLFLLQLFFIITSSCEDPATPVLYKYFPVFKRFTYSSFLHAIAKLLIYIISSFGVIFITKDLEHWGLLILMIPLGICYYFSVNYFAKLNLANANH